MNIQHQQNGKNGEFFLLDEQGNKIAELTYFFENENTINANHTYVSDSLRGQGVAAKLYQALVEFVKEKKLNLIPNITIMNDKNKIKELIQRIDEVLYYLWDPIGVSDEPCARAEYSSYTATILKYVLKEDLNQIANQLSKIEIEAMGLTTDKKHNLVIAQKLLDYKHAVEKGLK